MGDIAIRVENLSKSYRIAALRLRHDTLRDQVADAVKSLFSRNGTAGRCESTFWALKDVTFEVKQGEVLGLIGRNGAGKSTLLKVLSRITAPTSGGAEVYGRVGSLLEVGTGFDRELSGRENIYLSGAILGMTRAEISKKFDEIAAFAEVESFLDTPVKRYSSGMYLRLAFAVAAHLDPEILLVDEVLAVGDAVFQKKCLGKMGEVAGKGRTVIFVSHNMAAIGRLCQTGIWLEKGRVKAIGTVDDLVGRYLASGVQELGEVVFDDESADAHGSEYIRLLAVRVRGTDGKVTTALDVRTPFHVELDYEIVKRVSMLRLGFQVIAQDGSVVFASTDMDEGHDGIDRKPGAYRNTCTIPGEFLNYGQYFVSVGCDFPMVRVHFFLDRVLSFTVEQTGGVGGSIPDGRSGLLRVKLPWSLQQLG